MAGTARSYDQKRQRPSQYRRAQKKRARFRQAACLRPEQSRPRLRKRPWRLQRFSTTFSPSTPQGERPNAFFSHPCSRGGSDRLGPRLGRWRSSGASENCERVQRRIWAQKDALKAARTKKADSVKACRAEAYTGAPATPAAAPAPPPTGSSARACSSGRGACASLRRCRRARCRSRLHARPTLSCGSTTKTKIYPSPGRTTMVTEAG